MLFQSQLLLVWMGTRGRYFFPCSSLEQECLQLRMNAKFISSPGLKMLNRMTINLRKPIFVKVECILDTNLLSEPLIGPDSIPYPSPSVLEEKIAPVLSVVHRDASS